MKDNEGFKFFTVKELAHILRIGKNSAYRLVKVNGFPVLKIRGRLVIPADSLRTWITQNLGTTEVY